MSHTIKWAVYWAAVAIAISPHHARAQDAAGEWHGAVTSPALGTTLRIGITLTAKGGGAYEGMLTSPDQGNVQVPLDSAKVENGALSFSISALQISYSGRWDEAKKAWVGDLNQGAAVPLVLTAGKP
jgi:hypothetical protein